MDSLHPTATGHQFDTFRHSHDVMVPGLGVRHGGSGSAMTLSQAAGWRDMKIYWKYENETATTLWMDVDGCGVKGFTMRILYTLNFKFNFHYEKKWLLLEKAHLLKHTLQYIVMHYDQDSSRCKWTPWTPNYKFGTETMLSHTLDVSNGVLFNYSRFSRWWTYVKMGSVDLRCLEWPGRAFWIFWNHLGKVWDLGLMWFNSTSSFWWVYLSIAVKAHAADTTSAPIPYISFSKCKRCLSSLSWHLWSKISRTNTIARKDSIDWSDWFGLEYCVKIRVHANPWIRGIFLSCRLGGANGKTKARLANRGWFDDLTHI